ncbi:MAG: hypothetical protein ACREA0_13825 [bacterium]
MSDEAGSAELLRFEARPSFEPQLVLRLVRRDGKPFSYALICKTGGYGPQVGSWEIPLEKEATESLITELAAIRLPLIAESAIGLDGTTYSLTITRGFNQVSLSWWGSPPGAWKSMGPLLERLVSLAGPRATGIRLW